MSTPRFTQGRGAYLAYLFKPETQALIAKFGYRPAYPQHAAAADLKRFPKIELVKIDQQVWRMAAAQKKFFADGGVFDEIQRKIGLTRASTRRAPLLRIPA